MMLAMILWRRLRSNPAIHYKSPKLELSRAWEPSDSSRPSPNGEGEAAQGGFLNGNQDA